MWQIGHWKLCHVPCSTLQDPTKTLWQLLLAFLSLYLEESSSSDGLGGQSMSKDTLDVKSFPIPSKGLQNMSKDELHKSLYMKLSRLISKDPWSSQREVYRGVRCRKTCQSKNIPFPLHLLHASSQPVVSASVLPHHPCHEELTQQTRKGQLLSKSKQFLPPQSEMAWVYGNDVLHEVVLQTRSSLSSDRNGKGSTFPALSAHNNSSFQEGMAWKLQLWKPVFHRVTPPDPDSSSPFFRLWTSPWCVGQATSPMQLLSLGKEQEKKRGGREIKKK